MSNCKAKQSRLEEFSVNYEIWSAAVLPPSRPLKTASSSLLNSSQNNRIVWKTDTTCSHCNQCPSLLTKYPPVYSPQLPLECMALYCVGSRESLLFELSLSDSTEIFLQSVPHCSHVRDPPAGLFISHCSCLDCSRQGSPVHTVKLLLCVNLQLLWFT